MALLESMAAGLPIIVSSLGGLPETVGSAGRLVTPGSVDDLAATIADLGTMDVDRLGLTARRRWRETFSPVVGLIALEQVYAEAKR
jgi:glycosyltransferase involved in cell wall biosynthesis